MSVQHVWENLGGRMFELVLPDCSVPIFMLLVLSYRTAYCSFLCHGSPLLKSQPNINEAAYFPGSSLYSACFLSYANSCWPMLPAYFFLIMLPKYPKCKEKVLITVSAVYRALTMLTIPSAWPVISTPLLDCVSINFTGFIVRKMSTGGVCCLYL